MTPIAVTARLRGAIALSNGPIALDALLAAAVCLRDGIPPATDEAGIVPIEIPVAREPGGRFHLATVSFGTTEEAEHRWTNRRFPLAEAQDMADAKLRRIQITAGPCKSYRLPLATGHLEGDELHWWCLGELDAVRDLLVTCVSYLGKRRAVGLGKVERWTVEPCEPWDGFPVVRGGLPMRPIPPDWPGLSPKVETAYRTITYPYWRRTAEELLAVPAWT